jgi:hypothetical protein
MRALIAALLLIPAASETFSDLTDIGLINADGAPLTLIAEYSNGRKIDIHLERGESLLTGRNFGERITKITVHRKGNAPRIYDLAQLRQRSGKQRADWLCIQGAQTRMISSDERQALERTNRPN